MTLIQALEEEGQPGYTGTPDVKGIDQALGSGSVIRRPMPTGAINIAVNIKKKKKKKKKMSHLNPPKVIQGTASYEDEETLYKGQ